VRSGQGPTFAAVTGGFEHTTFGLLDSALDLGAILEYSYDGGGDLTYNIYDNDVFGGLRLSFNDVQGTEVLAGLLQDVEDDVTLGTLEASRRLGLSWRVELIGRLFRSGDDQDPVYWFRRDDYLQTSLDSRSGAAIRLAPAGLDGLRGPCRRCPLGAPDSDEHMVVGEVMVEGPGGAASR